MIKTCEELNQARVQAQLEIQSYACRILVCSGTGCIATGSHKIHERFEDLVKETPGIELVFSPCGGHDGETVVGVKKTGCQGFCELGPLVRIQKGDKVIQYVKVQPEDCAEIVEKSVLGDEVIERLLYKKGEKVYVQPDEIPFIAKQTRIVLENCGKFDAESLDEYLASGGFDALKKAMFAMTRDEVIDEVDRSGLRGRGGGGFPTGRKWKQVARQKETGGGLANMVDRLRMGYVVDMIETAFMDFPVFNVADCFITCGCVLLMGHLVLFNKAFWKDKKK